MHIPSLDEEFIVDLVLELVAVGIERVRNLPSAPTASRLVARDLDKLRGQWGYLSLYSAVVH